MTRPQDDDEVRAADDDGLVCAACRQPITSEAHAIEQAGAHAHVFVNPGGFEHHVRCFGFAEGLAEQGSPETYFSWFPGYSWQIVACGRCGLHTGWRFRCADATFWGLIAERLAES